MAPMGPFCKPRVFTRGYDFQLSKVVAFNAEWLYNVLEHKTESEDCHMTRQDYINAILKLLEKADFRQLRLVWVYASHLIG